MSKFGKYNKLIGLLCAIITGALFVLIFPNGNFWSGAFFFAVPLLGWLTRQKLSFKVIVFVYLTGYLAWLASMIWLRHVTWGGLLILCGFLAIFYAGWFCLAASRLRGLFALPLSKKLLRLTEGSALWVSFEFIRGHIFTGFPWSPLAASQWQNPAMLAFSDLLGHYGTSFILIFFNLALLSYGQKLFGTKRVSKTWSERICWEFYLAIGLVAASLFYYSNKLLLTRETEEIGQIAFIQPDIPATLKWDPNEAQNHLATLAKLSRWSALTEPDLILWPEAATPYPVYGSAEMNRWITDFSKELNTPFLIGTLSYEDSTWQNLITSISPENGVNTNPYGKRQLVPFGEYVPLRDYLPMIDKVVPLSDDIVPGQKNDPLSIYFNETVWKVGVLVCYEDAFPKLARTFTETHCDFIFVATNNAWYGTESGAYQHAALSVLRAAESKRPVLRSGNNGWSGWIDELGRIQEVMTDEKNSVYFQGSSTMNVFSHPRLSKERSFYHTYGDWFAYLSLLSFFPIIIRVFREIKIVRQ